ncbi:MAG: hypothetical protein ACRYHA_11715 [Janthinobacterium lividum]
MTAQRVAGGSDPPAQPQADQLGYDAIECDSSSDIVYSSPDDFSCSSSLPASS